MNKKIIHFGQDPHKPEFYNLIIVVSEILSDQLLDIKHEVFKHGFTIYYIDEDRIEACYKNRYMEVLNKYRELNGAGLKKN